MATQLPANDPVLQRFRAALTATYGERLDRAILFGSRARGDQRPDSDYDIAVFLKNLGPLWKELHPLAVITTDILYDTGAVISAKPFKAESYDKRTTLMQEIRREGIEL